MNTNTTPRCSDARVERIVTLFETLTPADIARFGEVYAADVRFVDPFNDTRGVAAVQAVFTHMFSVFDDPHFVVRDILVEGDACFLTWDFMFRFKRRDRAQQSLHGSSFIRLDAQGRVASHRDYWDTASELYEKLPIVGTLMRWIKRRSLA